MDGNSVKKILFAFIACCTSICFADNTDGVRLIPLPEASNYTRAQSHRVPILSVKLTEILAAMQHARSKQLYDGARGVAAGQLPSRVDLGMNGVPRFNQGHNGTCVTFAITAAIDASLGKGDYVSQLCLLQLSSHLSANSYWYTGWNGSDGHQTLSHIAEYGLITKEDQKKGACNKVYEYPLNEAGAQAQLQLNSTEYHRYSHNVFAEAGIQPQLLFKIIHNKPDSFVTLGNNSDGWVSPTESLEKMRKSLAEGNRVALGYLLNTKHIYDGRNKSNFDTWFASKELKDAFNTQHIVTAADLEDWGQHYVVVYGYDDNITVTNKAGEKQKGVFYIRNSWDNGKDIEYMSYDYFKLMAGEAYSINTVKNN